MKADFLLSLIIIFKNIHVGIRTNIIMIIGKIISLMGVKLILFSNNDNTGKIPNKIGWNIKLFNFMIYFEYWVTRVSSSLKITPIVLNMIILFFWQKFERFKIYSLNFSGFSFFFIKFE